MTINAKLSKSIQARLSKLDLTQFEKSCMVQLVLDVSGSTESDYQNNKYDHALAVVAHTAFSLDDNGKLEVGAFNCNFEWCPDVTEDNYADYISKNIVNLVGGGTYYSEFVKGVCSQFESKNPIENVIKQGTSLLGKVANIFGFSKKVEEPVETIIEASSTAPEMPRLVFIFTDGADLQNERTWNSFEQNKDKKVFWQFIGVGANRGQFRFIDDLECNFNNIGFEYIDNLSSKSQNEIIESILTTKLSNWLKGSKV